MTELLTVEIGGVEVKMSLDTARKIALEYESYQLDKMIEREGAKWSRPKVLKKSKKTDAELPPS